MEDINSNPVKDMFRDILKLENIAADIYREAVKKTGNNEINTIIFGILKDEKKHIKTVKDILDILDNKQTPKDTG